MSRRAFDLFDKIASFPALLAAAERAVRGKRERGDAAAFFFGLERNLARLTDALQDGSWRPGAYRCVIVREPKARRISIPPFADRVVHQAIHAVVGPALAKGYIGDTYASLPGRGQHRAIRRFEEFRDRHAYVLRSDIYRYFPSLDHAVLKADLRRKIGCRETLRLLDTIIDGANAQETVDLYFPGDDLFAPFQRRRGLPLGSLTSQMLGNFYLAGLDHFVKEVLRAPGYVRYLDDIALFGDDREQLAEMAGRLQRYLDRRRLRLHPQKTWLEESCRPQRFLGYILLPGGYRRLPEDNLGRAAQRLYRLRAGWRAGELDEATVRQHLGGWVAHARQADTWRLRYRWFPGGWFDPQGEPARPRRGCALQ